MDGSILVIDPDATTRDLVSGNLGHAGYRVSCATDVGGAQAALRQERPDLAVLDWTPGTPGLMFARQLRSDRRTAGTSIIVLSACANEHERVAALESGADDYITKPFSMREFLARVKAVLRRRAPQLADEVLELANLRFDPAAHRVSVCGRDLELRKTEFRLLHFFMTHPLRAFSRRKLLDEVWGDHVFVEERTVDVHIRRLRHALAPTGHGELIETVRGVGYRFRADTAPAAASVHCSVFDQLKRMNRLAPLAQANATA